MTSIRAKAEEEAHRRLGTLTIHVRLETTSAEIKSLETERSQLETAMYRQALGEDGTRGMYEYHLKSSFQNLLNTGKQQIESELLMESPIGREILKLRDERDALLDTVWLATSNAQIRDLWRRVSIVLGDDVTPLQQQVLAEKTVEE